MAWFDLTCCKPCSLAVGSERVISSLNAFTANYEVDITYEFPPYAMPSKGVLALTAMEAHEKVIKELVVWRPGIGHLIFISHAWTSLQHPDPTGGQFRVLQELVRNLQETVHMHREAYSKTANLNAKGADFSQENEIFIWLDYWSIPQAHARHQLKGIASIAAYVRSSAIMFVLVPPIAHQETGIICNYESYCKRGWCRLERLGFFLKDYKKGVKPEIYILTGENGADFQEAQITTNIVWNPGVSVFTADFTCCSRGHRLNGKAIHCDRQALVPIITTMLHDALDRARIDDDMPLFRKMLAHEWTLYAGLDPVLSPMPTYESAKEFLETFELKGINTRTESGHTALHYAAWANDASVVRFLVEAEGDLEALDKDGDSPLVASIFSESLLSTKTLLECRANVGSSRPYCVASAMDRPQALEMILQARADPNGRTPKDHPMALVRNSTGLLTASRRGFLNVVRILLRYKADPKDTAGPENTNAGSSAFDMAKSGGHEEVLQALVSHYLK